MTVHILGNHDKTVCGRPLGELEVVNGWGPEEQEIATVTCKKCLLGGEAFGRWSARRREALA